MQVTQKQKTIREIGFIISNKPSYKYQYYWHMNGKYIGHQKSRNTLYTSHNAF